MIKLTATHLTILAAAASREDCLAVRPDALRPAGTAKIAAKLLEFGLVRELRAKGDMPVWREDEHGKAFSLKIMKAGRAAVLALMPSAAGGEESTAGSSAAAQEGVGAQQQHIAAVGAARPGSKRALILDLLSRDGGASIQTLMAATGWLPHTTRAALSGLRRGGFTIARSRDEEGGASTYRVEPALTAAAA